MVVVIVIFVVAVVMLVRVVVVFVINDDCFEQVCGHFGQNRRGKIVGVVCVHSPGEDHSKIAAQDKKSTVKTIQNRRMATAL